MPNVSGTPRGVMIEGINFNTAGDTNVVQIFTVFENTMNPSSGNAYRQMTKRVPSYESVVLMTNADDREQLKFFAESTDLVNMSITLRSGDTYATRGTIEVENNETEQSRVTLQMLPEDDWVAFIA